MEAFVVQNLNQSFLPATWKDIIGWSNKRRTHYGLAFGKSLQETGFAKNCPRLTLVLQWEQLLLYRAVKLFKKKKKKGEDNE